MGSIIASFLKYNYLFYLYSLFYHGVSHSANNVGVFRGHFPEFSLFALALLPIIWDTPVGWADFALT
jgi:hypothetical protein